MHAYDPVGEPVRGRDAIVADWLKNPDQPGTWQASYRPLVVEGDRAVAVGRTTYTNGKVFENLYVLRFAADGRCAEFTEWYWRHRPPKAARRGARASPGAGRSAKGRPYARRRLRSAAWRGSAPRAPGSGSRA